MDNQQNLENAASDEGAKAMDRLTAASASTQSRTGILSFMRRSANFVRRHRRHPVCIVGVLDILDRNVPLDGLVTEISEGGALFRPASSFIFDRRYAPVSLRFTDREWRGEIVNVKADGYGIRLDQTVTADEIAQIASLYGAEVSLAG
jgi:hypothetical protein